MLEIRPRTNVPLAQFLGWCLCAMLPQRYTPIGCQVVLNSMKSLIS